MTNSICVRDLREGKLARTRRHSLLRAHFPRGELTILFFNLADKHVSAFDFIFSDLVKKKNCIHATADYKHNGYVICHFDARNAR